MENYNKREQQRTGHNIPIVGSLPKFHIGIERTPVGCHKHSYTVHSGAWKGPGAKRFSLYCGGISKGVPRILVARIPHNGKSIGPSIHSRSSVQGSSRYLSIHGRSRRSIQDSFSSIGQVGSIGSLESNRWHEVGPHGRRELKGGGAHTERQELNEGLHCVFVACCLGVACSSAVACLDGESVMVVIVIL
jgi:hypothetical protein